MTKRKGAATMKGNPLTLLGEELKPGMKAPDFVVQGTDLKDARLSDFKGKIKLIASVPSLDTPVCEMEIKRFNQEAAGISKGAVILFISMDLPFAQNRFCGGAGIQNVKTFSDHREADFGVKYGVVIEELRLLSRAIFLVDQKEELRYVEYVKEVSAHPNYEAALKALKGIG
ncbi:MAG: thiol peroxidase [Candidatus Omnitrophica bacterium]|nr:thiol peroxidase [Candidatus Omnitrophota bacterium]